MAREMQMSSIAPLRTMSVAEQVFESLHQQILTFELPPGAKMSEVEVSNQMGISRQPVREAFFRLSQLGFLLIRPQRATIVRKISGIEVLQAMYIRSALESKVVHEAVTTLTTKGLDQLSLLLEQQEVAAKASDKIQFHLLDDAFHKTICDATGVGFVWTLIKEKKTHMDRVRYLSLSFGVELALSEHKVVFEALRERDGNKAVEAIRKHLSRIKVDLPRIRQEHEHYFAQEDE
ncbi:MAG: GntR family transcriptional regulator [Rhodobacteraceae bacterium]|nr:GntR family transcriptional regulator [Paracoccaceae bacterium]